MRDPDITRALFLAPLVPLLGVAGLGFCAGYDSIGSSLGFALVWSIFLYPLGFVGALVAHYVLKALKLDRIQYYFGAWFFGGLLVVGGWFGQVTELHITTLFASAGGLVSGGAGCAFWHLAFGKPQGPATPVQREPDRD